MDDKHFAAGGAGYLGVEVVLELQHLSITSNKSIHQGDTFETEVDFVFAMICSAACQMIISFNNKKLGLECFVIDTRAFTGIGSRLQNTNYSAG